MVPTTYIQMSLRNATVIATKDSENSQSIFQYLNNQLNSINYIVTESIIFVNEIDLNSKIANLKDHTIFLLSNNYSFILELLSKAFNESVVVESAHLASVYNNSKTKMSLPVSSKILQIQNHANGINPVCINIENVFVLPDDLHVVEEIWEKSLLPLLSYDRAQIKNTTIGKRFILRCTQKCGELFHLKFANDILDSVPVIQYCTVKRDSCEQNVILHSSSFSALTKCVSIFKNVIPNNLIMNETIEDSYLNRVLFLDGKPYVQEALQVITKCYQDYEPETVFLSFNGGKDCTVLLYLSLYILKTHYPQYKDPLLCLYVQSNDPFEEVNDFIQQCRLLYNMELVTIKNNVKQGLVEILKQRPHLKACLMGTRRTDPFAETLNHFQMCDPGWPRVMRISPLLDWNYSDIWNFILTCKIPYCCLYDLGYTSLGSTANTIPNPYLKTTDECSGLVSHIPAYLLKDGSKERSGRK